MRKILKLIDETDMRLIAALGLLALSLVSTAIVNPDNSGVTRIKSYPATVCPANLSNGTSTSVIPSPQTLVRQVPTKNNKLTKAKTTFYLSSKPLLVDGNFESSINVTRSKSGSLATVVCSISGGDQWFIGGSGTVSSRASIEIVNSGLSTSVVDLIVYTSNSVSSVISKRINRNSSKRIYLDTLAPGEESIVVHSITRSGRVTTFVHDQRERGISSLGADFVSQGADPAKRIVIPAISNVNLVDKKATQTLRILVPGKVDANVRAKIFSNDGSFVPIGLDNINVVAGKVIDLPIKPVLQARNYSLVLSADRPIVASVKSSRILNGRNEFTWSTSVTEFKSVSLHLGGLTPDVVFQGKNFEVDIQWIDKNRKLYSKTIRSANGDEWAIWRPKNGVLRVSFSTTSSQVYAGMIFKETVGLSYLPVVAGAQLESAAVPNSDARIISR